MLSESERERETGRSVDLGVVGGGGTSLFFVRDFCCYFSFDNKLVKKCFILEF